MSTPSRYRFTVGSAGEAVTLLQERFGSRARVVSVRQMEGKGLNRFLSAPKLEVVAEVQDEGSAPSPNAAPTDAPTSVLPSVTPPLAYSNEAADPFTGAAATDHVSDPRTLARLLRAGGIGPLMLTQLQ